jgi:hypothetical protein
VLRGEDLMDSSFGVTHPWKAEHKAESRKHECEKHRCYEEREAFHASLPATCPSSRHAIMLHPGAL